MAMMGQFSKRQDTKNAKKSILTARKLFAFKEVPI